MHSYVHGTWLFRDIGSLEFQLIGYQIREWLARYVSKLEETNYMIVRCRINSGNVVWFSVYK